MLKQSNVAIYITSSSYLLYMCFKDIALRPHVIHGILGL